MVGKQWVKSWGMYKWVSEACTLVRAVSNNKSYEAESNAINTTFQNKSIARTKAMFIATNREDGIQLLTDRTIIVYHSCMYVPPGT